ncbi:unnamed protein product [Microthlaspi erraticum]|uniref:Uncharacterized protein n=1 Tax=Microthlaspi erraticum TaxID=1685480 RepID=A0A6D2IS20_9BRAS|nr:unnamed protein product [Microthlaspi erraticum]
MADSSPASFLTQANALLRKNLVFQKRNIWSNVRLITIPLFLCILLLVVQMLFDTQFNDVHGQCGCLNEKTCGLRYSTSEQAAFCAIPNPPQWTPLLQIALPQYRPAIQNPNHASPATFFFTGNNQSLGKKIKCVQGSNLWRNSSSDVNNELYKGYRKGNPDDKINEYAGAFDFQNTNRNNLNVTVWYNSTYKNDTVVRPMALIRVPRLVNMASNSYLEFLKGSETKILFEYVKEMPKPETKLNLDITSLIGPLFFTWVILLLFPLILTTLVYEKQQRLRIMMKMHGLGDAPYWIVSYTYFLLISVLYMLCFAVFGSAIGLNFFRLNDYSIQLVFFLIYINLQISVAILASAIFSDVKTATVIAYIYVFGTGLLGIFLFQFFLEDPHFPRGWIIVMELYPGFSLYRGLYELSQAAFSGDYRGVDGIRWGDFDNGMKEVTCIMLVEWLLLLVSSYYIDQITYSRKHPLFFLRQGSSKKKQHHSFHNQISKVVVEMEKPDVCQESEKVEQCLLESTGNCAVLCYNLKKVYSGKDGNPKKLAVRGLSLALPQGECFGMLGPNGAGKTSFINMMTGLTKPSSGTAFVQGLDILTDMDKIYTTIGVCPQHEYDTFIYKYNW